MAEVEINNIFTMHSRNHLICKRKDNFTVNKEIHTYNTNNNYIVDIYII
jgi:hypothetical protein